MQFSMNDVSQMVCPHALTLLFYRDMGLRMSSTLTPVHEMIEDDSGCTVLL